MNCRSIRIKFSELLQLVENTSCPLTAIAVTEMWLTIDTQDPYHVPGYKLVSHPCIYRTGRGVGFFINNLYEHTVRSDLCCTAV